MAIEKKPESYWCVTKKLPIRFKGLESLKNDVDLEEAAECVEYRVQVCANVDEIV